MKGKPTLKDKVEALCMLQRPRPYSHNFHFENDWLKCSVGYGAHITNRCSAYATHIKHKHGYNGPVFTGYCDVHNDTPHIRLPDYDLDSAMIAWARHINWALELEPKYCDRCGSYYDGKHSIEACNDTLVQNVMTS